MGEKFFRVAFFEHADVTAHHVQDESLERTTYIRDLERVSFSDFVPSFLNIPTFDDKYYEKKFWSIFYSGIIGNKWISFPAIAVIVIVFLFLLHLGLWEFLQQYWTRFGEAIKQLKFW